MSRGNLPSGTVTFLFTDVEGSTKLLHALGEGAYADALAEHHRIVRAGVLRHGGVEVDTQGDAFFVAFADALEAVLAAADVQNALAGGPISVRMGIHTGTPLLTDTGYVGVDVHRAARIAAAGSGEQVLLSAATAALVAGDRVSLCDLGQHRFKDLAAPERIYQVGDRAFPPLKTLSASNLPVPTTPFTGRAEELAKLTALLAGGAHMITVTGPGGVGKTRLALQVAAESAALFPDGLCWIALAPLSTAEETPMILAQTLGVNEREGVSMHQAIAARLEGRRMLILLDNAEHLLPNLAPVVARLLAASDRLTVLTTSRERLKLAAEHVFAVPPLTKQDAVALFRQYAAALGLQLDQLDTVEALCERLDRLPLAIQLAAARLRTFTPRQLLARISVRLDLLKGVRDLEPRQKTLRTTIAWSHDLLTSAEQALFKCLAVFAGGATLEAAESVCNADVDALEGLVDKSLVQRSHEAPHPRFWMLESIGDFAAEQLAQSDERRALRAQHAHYFRRLAEEMEAALSAGDPEEGPVSVLEAEIANLRAAVEFGLETDNHDLVRQITAALPLYWISRGLFTEARSWLDRAVVLEGPEDDMHRRLLSALAAIAYQQGDHAVAVAASDEAASLAMRLGGVTEQYQRLRDRIRAARLRGDLDEAEKLFEEALGVTIAAGNGVGTSACRLGLASLANKTGRPDRAQALLAENLPFVQSKGQTRCEAYTLAGMAETSVYGGRLDAVVEVSLRGARRAAQIHDRPLIAYLLDLMAVGAAARGEGRLAATLLGTTEAAREAMGAAPDDDETAIRTRAVDLLGADLTKVADAWAAGRGLDLGSALELVEKNTPR